MAKNFDLTTLEMLLQRLEKENNPELNGIVNDLIMTSKKAGASGFTLNEIANLCTMGFIVSQDPELQSFVTYLITRLQDTDGVFN
tara:strand:- start:2361 stop:2615 length:255 start_codon:yes stop_codon:yes gene_type:complete